MQFTFVGKRSLWDEVDEQRFSSQAKTISGAIRNALLQAIEREDTGELKGSVKAEHKFALYLQKDQGEKLILTVNSEGSRWSDAIEKAYVRVCGWQGKEPELPERHSESCSAEGRITSIS